MLSARKTESIVIDPFVWTITFAVIAVSVGMLATEYAHLAFVPAVFLIGLLAITRHPEWGFYVMVFLIPFDAYRDIFSGAGPFTITKGIGIWIALILAICLTWDMGIPVRLKSRLWPTLFLFFMVCLISAVCSPYPVVAFDYIRNLITAIFFFVFVLTFCSYRHRYLRTLPILIMISIASSAGISVYGYFTGNEQFYMTVAQNIQRAYGSSLNPNQFGALMAFTFPIFAYFVFFGRTTFERIFFATLGVLNFTALVLTYSRSIFLIWITTTALLLFEMRHLLRPRHLGYILVLSAVIIASIAVFTPEAYWERQQSLTDKTDLAIARRWSYLQFAPEAIMRNPIIGSGPGTFRKLYGASWYGFAYIDEMGQQDRYAHNAYVETIVGTGVIGLSLFLVLLGLVYFSYGRAIKAFEKHGDLEMIWMTRAYRLCFIVMILSYLFGSDIFRKYWWIAIALSQVALIISEEDVNRENLDGTPSLD